MRQNLEIENLNALMFFDSYLSHGCEGGDHVSRTNYLDYLKLKSRIENPWNKYRDYN